MSDEGRTVGLSVTPVVEAELTARRRWAEHQLSEWLGVPSRTAHRMADRWLGELAAVDEAQIPDTMIDWSTQRRAA